MRVQAPHLDCDMHMQRSIDCCHHVSHLVVCDDPVRLGALRTRARTRARPRARTTVTARAYARARARVGAGAGTGARAGARARARARASLDQTLLGHALVEFQGYCTSWNHPQLR